MAYKLNTLTECFVFTATGQWLNFSHFPVLQVTRVHTCHPDGTEMPWIYLSINLPGLVSTVGNATLPATVRCINAPGVGYGWEGQPLAEGTDYELDLPNGKIRLLSNTTTQRLVCTIADNPASAGAVPFKVWVTYQWWGNEYAPSDSVRAATLAKIPNWDNAVRTKTELNVFLFGDSTNYHDVELPSPSGSFVSPVDGTSVTIGPAAEDRHMWGVKLAKRLKAMWPGKTVNMWYAGVGGSVTTDTIGVQSWVEAKLSAIGATNVQPDLVIITNINDQGYGIPGARQAYERDVTFLINYFRNTKGYTGLECVMQSGLHCNYLATSMGLNATVETWFDDMSANMASMATRFTGYAYVNTNNTWKNLFARKNIHSVLGNMVNHANSFSVLAYILELQSIIPISTPPTTPIPRITRGLSTRYALAWDEVAVMAGKTVSYQLWRNGQFYSVVNSAPVDIPDGDSGESVDWAVVAIDSSDLVSTSSVVPVLYLPAPTLLDPIISLTRYTATITDSISGLTIEEPTLQISTDNVDWSDAPVAMTHDGEQWSIQLNKLELPLCVFYVRVHVVFEDVSYYSESVSFNLTPNFRPIRLGQGVLAGLSRTTAMSSPIVATVLFDVDRGIVQVPVHCPPEQSDIFRIKLDDGRTLGFGKIR